MSRHAGFLLFALPIAFVALACGGGSSSSGSDLTVGALFDLSGPGQSLGQLSLSAAQLAAEEATQRGVSISIEVRDTQSNPQIAVEQLNDLLASGISIVLGPQTSSEASAVLPIANTAGALLVSQGSTASSLAIAGDALYRLVPTDRVESRAVYDLALLGRNDGFVTVNRDDTGNAGLVSSFTGYAAVGGDPVQPAITYPASQTTGFGELCSQIAASVSS